MVTRSVPSSTQVTASSATPSSQARWVVSSVAGPPEADWTTRGKKPRPWTSAPWWRSPAPPPAGCEVVDVGVAGRARGAGRGGRGQGHGEEVGRGGRRSRDIVLVPEREGEGGHGAAQRGQAAASASHRRAGPRPAAAPGRPGRPRRRRRARGASGPPAGAGRRWRPGSPSGRPRRPGRRPPRAPGRPRGASRRGEHGEGPELAVEVARWCSPAAAAPLVAEARVGGREAERRAPGRPASARRSTSAPACRPSQLAALQRRAGPGTRP